jgi:DNA-binding PadR family transcriptional regulator
MRVTRCAADFAQVDNTITPPLLLSYYDNRNTIAGTRQSRKGTPVTQDETIQKALPLKAAHFHILLSLADGPVHAYGVRAEIEARTDGHIVLAAGTLYETFQRMERDGWVEETGAPEELEGPVNSRWRFFRTTPLGRQLLEAEIVRLEGDLAAARKKIAPAN